MKLQFNDSHESDGFEEAIDAVNNLLKPHNLKVNKTFIEEDAEFEWKIKLVNTGSNRTMTRIELYDFLKTCPNQDWFIAGDDNNGIRVYFPVDDEVEE